MWCLRHTGALAWRRGPVCACTRVCWCRRFFTNIHTYATAKTKSELLQPHFEIDVGAAPPLTALLPSPLTTLLTPPLPTPLFPFRSYSPLLLRPLLRPLLLRRRWLAPGCWCRRRVLTFVGRRSRVEENDLKPFRAQHLFDTRARAHLQKSQVVSQNVHT